MRLQPTPREGGDPARVAASTEPHDDVDRSEAGAKQEDVVVGTQGREGVGLPRIANVDAARDQTLAQARRVMRRQVARRQHDAVDRQAVAKRQTQRESAADFAEGDRLVGHDD
jgi:hypothetical protein